MYCFNLHSYRRSKWEFRSKHLLQPHKPTSRISKPSLKILSFNPSMENLNVKHVAIIVEEIGGGMCDDAPIVHKGIVFLANYIVAIKVIDLDRTRLAFRNDRARKLRLSVLRHPNIPRCIDSVVEDGRLWVVTPYIDLGSLQSIISRSFLDGLPESCIAIVLREVLKGLCYLHCEGRLHRDIKAGNILVSSDGSVMLSDYGVSSSMYESWSLSSRDGIAHADLGWPYWLAPDAADSHAWYTEKADIWAIGITALELAYGRPPLSQLPSSQFMISKIRKRFQLYDFQKLQKAKNKEFTEDFKTMVASCLHQDSSRRPTALALLRHNFFRNCEGREFLVDNLLHNLPFVEIRYNRSKALTNDWDEDEEDDDPLRQNVEQRRISSWKFNEERFKLDPEYEDRTNTTTRLVHLGDQNVSDSENLENRRASGAVVEQNVGESSVIQIGEELQEAELAVLPGMQENLEDDVKLLGGLMIVVHGEEVIDHTSQMAQRIATLRRELEEENTGLEMEATVLREQHDADHFDSDSSGESGNTGVSEGSGISGNDGGFGNAGDSGGSGNPGNGGGSGNSGNGGGSGNAGDSGNSGNAGNSGGGIGERMRGVVKFLVATVIAFVIFVVVLFQILGELEDEGEETREKEKDDDDDDEEGGGGRGEDEGGGGDEASGSGNAEESYGFSGGNHSD